MDKELIKLVRDYGSSFLKLFRDGEKVSEERHKELITTIGDENVATRNAIKALKETKPEKPEKIDFTPVIKSNEAEANFTRKTIEAQTKEVQAVVKTNKEVVEASKSLKKAIESIKLTIPPFPEIKFPTIDFKPLTAGITKLFDLTKEGFNKLLARGTKKDPIYVKHLAPNGEEVDPTKVVAYGGFGGGSSSGSTDMTQTNALLQDIKTNTTENVITKASISVSATGVVLTPSSGKKLRIYAVKFSLSADLNSVGFNFNGSTAFEKYLKPKSGGLYGHNVHPSYFEGGLNKALEISIDGAGDVQVNVDYKEVS